MRFESLGISNWRQFAQVDIAFHPQLTIITGANGSGKSTVLRILGQHFGWPNNLLATPLVFSDGAIRWFAGLFRLLKSGEVISGSNQAGEIKYTNGVTCPMMVPAKQTAAYTLQITNQQSLDGLLINSHRPMPSYQQLDHIPTNPIGAQQAYHTYYTETVSRYQNNHTQYGPMYRMKEAIVSMAMFGSGNEFVHGNPTIYELFMEFKSILSKILPESIGFKDISIRVPDVVIVTDTGEFIIDAASGGLMSLIDLAWQIFLYSHGRNEFVVVFDEPENHLHPSMQRTLLRKLLNAFPGAQFVIATHSPFIVSSIKDSNVYVLRYVDGSVGGPTSEMQKRLVTSVKLDNVNKAGTAGEILREVLGVPVTLPEWAAADLANITQRFQVETLDAQTLAALRLQLENAGLSEFYPEALRAIANQ